MHSAFNDSKYWLIVGGCLELLVRGLLLCEKQIPNNQQPTTNN